MDRMVENIGEARSQTHDNPRRSRIQTRQQEGKSNFTFIIDKVKSCCCTAVVKVGAGDLFCLIFV